MSDDSFYGDPGRASASEVVDMRNHVRRLLAAHERDVARAVALEQEIAQLKDFLREVSSNLGVSTGMHPTVVAEFQALIQRRIG